MIQSTINFDSKQIQSVLRLLDADKTNVSDETVKETLATIVWSRLVEPGDVIAVQLLETFGARRSLEIIDSDAKPQKVVDAAKELNASFNATPNQVSAGLKRWLPRLDENGTLLDLQSASFNELKIVTPSNNGWPQKINDLGFYRPLMLWYRGDLSLLCTTSLAVVGARASSSYGEEVTTEMVKHAVHKGVTVVSGAAFGIDAVAHRVALGAGGKTIAVLAGGADRFYPAANEQLIKRISLDGLVCSEMIPGAAPTRWRFLQRNRCIASLSDATLVTEAGFRSGSLNTAGHAAQLGRPIGAVPGPITSVTSMGTHKLIKEYDAQIIASLSDLDELLSLDDFSEMSMGDDRELSLHSRVIDALPLRGFTSTSAIARQAGLSVSQSAQILTELEVLGRVELSPGGEIDKDEWALAEI